MATSERRKFTLAKVGDDEKRGGRAGALQRKAGRRCETASAMPPPCGLSASSHAVTHLLLHTPPQQHELRIDTVPGGPGVVVTVSEA
jgi:hypothetical protein